MGDKVNLEENLHYRVAMDLAIRIYSGEKVGRSNLSSLTSEEAREYWLRLYRQCFDVVANGESYDTVKL